MHCEHQRRVRLERKAQKGPRHPSRVEEKLLSAVSKFANAILRNRIVGPRDRHGTRAPGAGLRAAPSQPFESRPASGLPFDLKSYTPAATSVLLHAKISRRSRGRMKTKPLGDNPLKMTIGSHDLVTALTVSWTASAGGAEICRPISSTTFPMSSEGQMINACWTTFQTSIFIMSTAHEQPGKIVPPTTAVGVSMPPSAMERPSEYSLEHRKARSPAPNSLAACTIRHTPSQGPDGYWPPPAPIAFRRGPRNRALAALRGTSCAEADRGRAPSAYEFYSRSA
eukprot:4835673-Amphidinium_carterae.3